MSNDSTPGEGMGDMQIFPLAPGVVNGRRYHQPTAYRMVAHFLRKVDGVASSSVTGVSNRRATVVDVVLSDCKKGDRIIFKMDDYFCESTGQKKRTSNGVIKSLNKKRDTILVAFRAVIDGKLAECRHYIRPSAIVGFYP